MFWSPPRVISLSGESHLFQQPPAPPMTFSQSFPSDAAAQNRMTLPVRYFAIGLLRFSLIADLKFPLTFPLVRMACTSDRGKHPRAQFLPVLLQPQKFRRLFVNWTPRQPPTATALVWTSLRFLCRSLPSWFLLFRALYLHPKPPFLAFLPENPPPPIYPPPRVLPPM